MTIILRKAAKNENFRAVNEQVLELKTRNIALHKIFKERVPKGDLCLADFSCTLFKKDKLPRPGRLYITCQSLYFYSFIRETRADLHISKVKHLQANKVLKIPNGIKLLDEHRNVLMELTHFFYQDKAEQCILQLMDACRVYNLLPRDPLVVSSGNSVPRCLQKKVSMMIQDHVVESDTTSDDSVLENVNRIERDLPKASPPHRMKKSLTTAHLSKSKTVAFAWVLFFSFALVILALNYILLSRLGSLSSLA